MAKKYMERIEALRQQYLSTRVDMDVYNAKYVTEGFKETEGQPWIIQKATGYARTCEKKQIYIQDHELLVGGVGFKPRCGILNPDSASGVICLLYTSGLRASIRPPQPSSAPPG